MRSFLMPAAAGLATNVSHAALVSVTDEAGAPLATVMVTQTVTAARKLDTADGGYATPGKTQPVDAEVTRFTDAAGAATLPDRPDGLSYRLRKPGFRDAVVVTTEAGEVASGRRDDARDRPGGACCGEARQCVARRARRRRRGHQDALQAAVRVLSPARQRVHAHGPHARGLERRHLPHDQLWIAPFHGGPEGDAREAGRGLPQVARQPRAGARHGPVVAGTFGRDHHRMADRRHHVADARHAGRNERPRVRRRQHPGPAVRDQPADQRDHRLQDPAPAGRRARWSARKATQDVSAARQHLERALARGVVEGRPHLHHALCAAPHRRVRPGHEAVQAARDRRRLLSAHDPHRPAGPCLVHAGVVEPDRHARSHAPGSSSCTTCRRAASANG